MDKEMDKMMDELLKDCREKHDGKVTRMLELCFGAIRAGSSVESVVGLLNWIADTKKRGDYEILTGSNDNIKGVC